DTHTHGHTHTRGHTHGHTHSGTHTHMLYTLHTNMPPITCIDTHKHTYTCKHAHSYVFSYKKNRPFSHTQRERERERKLSIIHQSSLSETERSCYTLIPSSQDRKFSLSMRTPYREPKRSEIM